MRFLPRLLVCALAVAVPAQSWAAPMLCQSDADSGVAELEQLHGDGHRHHAGTNDGDYDHAGSSNECASDCECGTCIAADALSEGERFTVASYGIERTAARGCYLGPFINAIFRPPIRI